MPRRAALLSVCWIGLVLGLIVHSEGRDAAAGDPGALPATWPAASRLALAPDGLTLVMLVHPQCPCSAASVDELERLLRDVSVPVRAYALVVVPDGAPPGFVDAAPVERARAIAGLGLVLDAGGREAARFAARTSGHVAVYDAAGRLRFTGGITRARGSRGNGPGRAAVLSLIDAAPTGAACAPVFGCPLQEESR